MIFGILLPACENEGNFMSSNWNLRFGSDWMILDLSFLNGGYRPSSSMDIMRD